MAKQVDYKAVGLRIKTLRLKNNIYQTELAKNIGVSQTHMINMQNYDPTDLTGIVET